MKDQHDTHTADLAEPAKRGRGRPRKPNAKSATERSRKYRAASNTKSLYVRLSPDEHQALAHYASARNITQTQAIAKAIRELTRKR